MGCLAPILCVACSAEAAGVRSLDAVESTDPPAVSVPSSDVEFPSASLFSGAPTGVFPDASVVVVPHAQQDAEKAIHALTSTSEGWAAVGSITYPGLHGAAAFWKVALDGTFSPETLLPTPDGLPSFARSALADAQGSIAVGMRGSGRESVATAWVLQPDWGWSYIDLPLDRGQTHGAIADTVLRLADGTTVVVGRGNGPFFSDLMIWTSSDNGVTWTSTVAGTSFLEPLVATDGIRVATFLRTYSDPLTNLAGHTAIVFGMEDGVLGQLDISLIDLAPGRRYWPKSMAWDGTQFVVGMSLDVGPAVATSGDGVTYTVNEFMPPELDPNVPAGVNGLAMVDGSLIAAIDQGSSTFVFRRDGETFSAIPIPHIPRGSLAYLEYRSLTASDGHRFAYVAAEWDGLTMLIWDGQGWSSGSVSGLAMHRNSARLEVHALASAGGADLALLSEGYTEAPGRFSSRAAGLLWRPSGSDEWQQFAVPLVDWSSPVAITKWNDVFVVVGHDFTLNRSTLFRFDPATGDASMMAQLDGFVGAIVADAGHLYARLSSTGSESVGNSDLFQSSDGDGHVWSRVDVDFAPRVLCSDGTTAVVEWMTSDGGSSTMGTATLDGELVTPFASPFEFQRYQVEPEQDQVMRCAVNSEGVMAIVQGYDGVIAEVSPQARFIPFAYDLVRQQQMVLPVSREGAWKSDIRGITWNGHQWIAVGSGGDVEEAWDALMWRSMDGLLWEPPITLAGGPGNQMATSVVIRDGEILIGGFDGQNATIWRQPE